MTKTLKMILTLTLVTVLAVAMIGCSSSPAKDAAAPAEDAAAPAEDAAAPAEDAAATTVEGTTWALTSLTLPDGTVYEGDALLETTGGEITYEFKADGVVTVNTAQGSADATYEDLGDKLIMVDANGTESTFVFDGVDGTTMTTEVDGSTSVYALQ